MITKIKKEKDGTYTLFVYGFKDKKVVEQWQSGIHMVPEVLALFMKKRE